MTSRVIAATDGSAINNPNGPGGWAWFVSRDCWASGGFAKASNQYAELFAVLALLRAVPREHALVIRTDSQFAINSLTKWMPGWKRKGWVKADGQPPANLALLKELDLALAGRNVTFEWVRGHNGDAMNETADRLCTAASAAIRAGRAVAAGPGWIAAPASPVSASVASPQRRSTAPAVRRPAVTRPSSSAGPASARAEEARRSAWQDAEADAYIMRTMTNSVSRTKKYDLCSACDKPLNPQTGECLKCSA